MATRKLEAVSDEAIPDRNPTRARSRTTSFRIPTYWWEKVKAEADKHNVPISQIYNRALQAYFETGQPVSWETTDQDFYDPLAFYTRSEDKKGHSFHLRAPIPKPVAGEMNALIASQTVPQYRSVGDIVRDAIYHRLKYIANAYDQGELEQVIDMAMLLAEEIQLTDERVHAEQLIEQMRTNAEALWQKDRGRLKRHLATRREVADSLASPYRDDYLAVLIEYERRLAKDGRQKRRKSKDQ